MQCNATGLPGFIQQSDELGGPDSPACHAFWSDFTYIPSVPVDLALDPFGEPYVAQQLALYEELAGHAYDAVSHERTPIDIQRHVAARNPYDHPDPAVLAMHLERLAFALRHAGARRDEVLLDMGAGWGLSSEFSNYLGLDVVAVDIDAGFTQLIAQRAERQSLPIRAVNASFEDFTAPAPADLALFYECLHHAVRPWTVIKRIAGMLRPGGRLMLAGEPINAMWWPDWGMRLDALSIYCIRKFGWFESGWSEAFLLRMLHRAGLIPRVHRNADPLIGSAVIAEKLAVHVIPGDRLASLVELRSGFAEPSFLIIHGEDTLELDFPDAAVRAELTVTNYAPRPIAVVLRAETATLVDGTLPPGITAIVIPRDGRRLALRFRIEEWIPAQETGSVDARTLGLHVNSLTFFTAT